MPNFPFQRLQKEIEELIEKTPDGDRLLPEPEMAKQLGVSRATLREALRAFEAQGIIRRRQGFGTYVVGKEENKPHSTKKRLKVFLCHSSKDKGKAIDLYEKLIVEKWIDPWLDQKKLKPGQIWNFEIENAVRDSDTVIVCLSRNSVTKEGYVQKEIKLALDKADEKLDDTIYIIPLRFEDCDVPYRLKKYQWLDSFGDDWYGKLLESLELRAKSLGIDIN